MVNILKVWVNLMKIWIKLKNMLKHQKLEITLIALMDQPLPKGIEINYSIIPMIEVIDNIIIILN